MKAEHEDESILDAAQLVEREVPHMLAEGAHIDSADHLAHGSRRFAQNRHLGMEARPRCRTRGGTDDDRRESQQVVSLNDDGIAKTVLDPTTPPGQSDRVDVTTNHATPP